MTHPIITERQIKSARAAVGWSRDQLAAAASLSPVTIKRTEDNAASVRPQTVHAVHAALTRAGITFSSNHEIGFESIAWKGKQQ